MREVYLDNISTTKPYPEVVRVMTKVAETLYGNPSSSHEVGKKARRVVERARATLARYLKEPCKAIVFTSGATESMNIVLNGVMEKHGYDGVVLTSTIEHPAGIKPLEHLHKRHKVEVVKIPVDGEGFIDLEALKEAMKKHGSRVKLVTIMYANNEIGTLQDLRAIRKIVGKRVHFHSDTTQAAGKFRIRGVGALDSYVVSGHKIHSVKGVGALVLRRDPSCLSPLSWGGGQEKAVRPGTESPPLICALAEAVRLNCVRGAAVVNKMRKLRKALVTRCAELGGVFAGGGEEAGEEGYRGVDGFRVPPPATERDPTGDRAADG
eukprot:jgi/Mesvir1/5634/Mv15652-RA.1